MVDIPLIRKPAGLAKLIDHTLLKPDATAEQVRRLCAEASQHRFCSVCVNPIFVALAHRELTGSEVKTCSVIAFPFGATTTEAKVAETRRAVADGAGEIDMVIAIGALKAGDRDYVRRDIAEVKSVCGASVVLKTIIETSLLTDEEKAQACLLAKEAGADFVKTSTGYGGGGATVGDVALMRRTVGPALGVKASGGIRTFAQAVAMVEAGATRIGASSGVAMVTEARRADH
jgi:deoxyribose-phosphate aldolase